MEIYCNVEKYNLNINYKKFHQIFIKASIIK